jgi:hypothetical protein
MNRIEIESQLNRDRVWLIETYAMLPDELLTTGVTPSEHDPGTLWSPKDHLAHLAGIEHNFVRMIRKHVDGDPNPVGLRNNADGTARTMEQIMATVHEMTESWVLQHRAKSLADVIALGQQARSATLALLAGLTDEQLAEKLPGAPWADGTFGGVIATNAAHGRMHWAWVKGGMIERGMQAPR